MKLSFKIFLCFVILFGITFQAAGYLLINFAYQNAIGQEKKMAVQEFQHNKYILQSRTEVRNRPTVMKMTAG